jgi:Asp-tRNA(Asn)/Glu-tRNA(Gln) amidotransferase C subunit
MNAPLEQPRGVDVEVERLVAAARDALTDEMVSRLASTAGDAVELMDQVNRAGLARAIPALAQMVNNGDLERLSQLARLYNSAQDALTDEMVGRLTEAVADGLALIDQVNRAGLDRAIPALAEMVNNGDLNRLVKLVRVYGSAEDALTDEMVGRLTETVGNGLSLLDRASRGGAEHVVKMLEGLQESGALERIATMLPQLAERLATVQQVLQSIDEAAAVSRSAAPSAGGIGGLWHLMRDPESQETLRFMLAVGKQLRKGWGATK